MNWRTYLNFSVKLPTNDRAAALERRDQIVAKLAEIGIRLDMTDDGLNIHMTDTAATEIDPKGAA